MTFVGVDNVQTGFCRVCESANRTWKTECMDMVKGEGGQDSAHSGQDSEWAEPSLPHSEVLEKNLGLDNMLLFLIIYVFIMQAATSTKEMDSDANEGNNNLRNALFEGVDEARSLPAGWKEATSVILHTFFASRMSATSRICVSVAPVKSAQSSVPAV